MKIFCFTDQKVKISLKTYQLYNYYALKVEEKHWVWKLQYCGGGLKNVLVLELWIGQVTNVRFVH